MDPAIELAKVISLRRIWKDFGFNSDISDYQFTTGCEVPLHSGSGTPQWFGHSCSGTQHRVVRAQFFGHRVVRGHSTVVWGNISSGLGKHNLLNIGLHQSAGLEFYQVH